MPSVWTNKRTGLFYLIIVYLVWGSTYLAIRIAVRDGSGFTPFIMGAMRVLAAGGVLLLIGLINGQRLRITRRELLTLAGSGILLWTGGNGLVMLAERKADSALAALIIACTPVWVVFIESLLERKLPSIWVLGALALGICGIVILSLPMILKGLHLEIVAVVELVLATISWAGGTVWQSRSRPDLSPAVSSGYQSIFGGIGFVVMVVLFGEPLPNPIWEAWVAWGYLVIFGSIIAFTAYVLALRLLPLKLVTTYSYVNPIIAVFLGWLILNERITVYTFFGALLVLCSVAGVFHAQALEDSKFLLNQKAHLDTTTS